MYIVDNDHDGIIGLVSDLRSTPGLLLAKTGCDSVWYHGPFGDGTTHTFMTMTEGHLYSKEYTAYEMPVWDGTE